MSFYRNYNHLTSIQHVLDVFIFHLMLKLGGLAISNISQAQASLPSLLQVTGVVMDKTGKAHYVLSGTWDEKMEFSRVMQSSRGGENGTEGKQKTVYQTLKAREVWRRNPLP